MEYISERLMNLIVPDTNKRLILMKEIYKRMKMDLLEKTDSATARSSLQFITPSPRPALSYSFAPPPPKRKSTLILPPKTLPMWGKNMKRQ